MQVSVETTSALERRLTIAIPAARVQEAIDRRIRDVAPKVKLDGFRSGKVPVHVVRQRFGDDIRQEVLGDLMSSSFQEAVIQEKLKPAGRPMVEPRQMAKGKDFSFTAVFEIYPEISVKDLSGVAISRAETSISDADVDEMISILRKQRATHEVTDGAVAALGDKVNIDFDGFREGVAFEGGKAEQSDLVLGSKSMIPGFEDGLVGLKAGDEKELSLTFPADYHAEHLKGASVVFKVRVNSVAKEQMPALDSKFMESFGVKDGSEETFRNEVRKNMERELRQAKQSHLKKQVIDALLERNQFDIPGSLVQQEIGFLRNQMLQQFGGAERLQNMDLGKIFPDQMFSAQAERRVSLGLLFSRLIESSGLKAEPAKVREAVEELASAYEDRDEVVDYYYGDRKNLAQVEAMVLEDLVIAKVLESAAVSDQKLGYQELMRLVGK
jgi:trigger factor